MKSSLISHVDMKPLGFRVWKGVTQADMPQAHSHPEIEINLVVDGICEYMHAGAFYKLQKNDLAIFWAGLPHKKINSRGPVEMIWLTLPLPWLLSWQLPEAFREGLLKGILFKEQLDDQQMLQDQRQMNQWIIDFSSASSAARRTLLLELEARFMRFAMAYPEEKATVVDNALLQKLEQAMAYLHENFRRHITVDDIAADVDLHPKYFMRLFKEQLSVSVWDYLSQLRVARAQWLLLSSDMKIAELASEAGFQSTASFYENFRKFHPDMKPKEYRKLAGGAVAINR